MNARVSRASAATILLGWSLAMPVAARADVNGRSNIQIDNFGRVNANYYRGAQPEGHDYADLAAFGIKTVIDLTQDGDAQEPAIVQRLGMKFHRNPVKLHAEALNDRRFLGIAILGQVDDGLDAERREIRVVMTLRLSATVVIRVDAAEVVDLNVRASVDVGSSRDRHRQRPTQQYRSRRGT